MPKKKKPSSKLSLLYRYDKATDKAITALKQYTGESTATKAITQAIKAYVPLMKNVEQLEQDNAQLRQQLSGIKEIYRERSSLSR